MVVVGQLSRAASPYERLAGVPVALTAGEDVRVRAQSDARGEFHLETGRADGLHLEIALPEGRVIRIPLERERRDS